MPLKVKVNTSNGRFLKRYHVFKFTVWTMVNVKIPWFKLASVLNVEFVLKKIQSLNYLLVKNTKYNFSFKHSKSNLSLFIRSPWVLYWQRCYQKRTLKLIVYINVFIYTKLDKLKSINIRIKNVCEFEIGKTTSRAIHFTCSWYSNIILSSNMHFSSWKANFDK